MVSYFSLHKKYPSTSWLRVFLDFFSQEKEFEFFTKSSLKFISVNFP